LTELKIEPNTNNLYLSEISDVVEHFINFRLSSFRTRTLSIVAERTLLSRPHSGVTQRYPLSPPHFGVTTLRATTLRVIILWDITLRSSRTCSAVTITLRRHTPDRQNDLWCRTSFRSGTTGAAVFNHPRETSSPW